MCRFADFKKNQIKAQAHDHERFRRVCVSVAQSLHRLDMRLRLGLLRDSAAIERQAARDAAEAEAKKYKPTAPTVKTKAETKAEEAAVTKAKEKAVETVKHQPRPRIRPLSESKAIDSGANFISEAFLFAVAGGLIVFESWRSRRKESSRREDVQDRLNELERAEKATREALVAFEQEVMALKAKNEKVPLKDMKCLLPRDVAEEENAEESADQGRLSRILSLLSFGRSDISRSQKSNPKNQSDPLPSKPPPHSSISTASTPSRPP